MNYAKKIVCFLFITSAISMVCSDNKETLTYIQRRNKRTQEKKECLQKRPANDPTIKRPATKKNKRMRQTCSTRTDQTWSLTTTPPKRRVTGILGVVADDIIRVNLGLISWDSFKIFVITAPFFVGARMIDDKLHNCFFNHNSKKNRNEPAQWCKEIARLSIGVPIALLGVQAFVSNNRELQTTGQVFLTGMPFVLLIKDLIKKLDFDLCKRPFHEKFATEQRKFGGFPSGHLAEATYTAVLYGMRYGPNAAVPLGGVAAFVTVIFLSSNRHYLSQMIAGAGFGAMYALSANKIINSKLAQENNLKLGLTTNKNGDPAIKLSLRF